MTILMYSYIDFKIKTREVLYDCYFFKLYLLYGIHVTWYLVPVLRLADRFVPV